jgi:hypothetical protein
MACIPSQALQAINFACESPTGGLKSVYVGYRTGNDDAGNPLTGLDLLSGYSIDRDSGSPTFGQVTVTTLSDTATDPAVTGPLFHEIKFNNKDGVSVFTDALTVEANGSKSVVPSIAIEIPLMNPDNNTALGIMSEGGELVALVETAAGTYHMVGADFGLYTGSIEGNSGAQRTDKNHYLLTLTGLESQLSYSILSEADYTAFATYSF